MQADVFKALRALDLVGRFMLLLISLQVLLFYLWFSYVLGFISPFVLCFYNHCMGWRCSIHYLLCCALWLSGFYYFCLFLSCSQKSINHVDMTIKYEVFRPAPLMWRCLHQCCNVKYYKVLNIANFFFVIEGKNTKVKQIVI